LLATKPTKPTATIIASKKSDWDDSDVAADRDDSLTDVESGGQQSECQSPTFDIAQDRCNKTEDEDHIWPIRPLTHFSAIPAGRSVPDGAPFQLGMTERLQLRMATWPARWLEVSYKYLQPGTAEPEVLGKDTDLQQVSTITSFQRGVFRGTCAKVSMIPML